MINKVLVLSSFLSIFALGLILLTSRCSSDREGLLSRPILPLPDDVKRIAVAGNFGGQLRYALAGELETFNYVGAQWSLQGNDYDTLQWYDDTPKPSKAELDAAWPAVQQAQADDEAAAIAARQSAVDKLTALGLTVDEISAAFGLENN